MARILLTNATIVTGASSKKGALAIDGERMAGIWYPTARGTPTTPRPPARSRTRRSSTSKASFVMAGGIDAHMRPGTRNGVQGRHRKQSRRPPCSAESHPSSTCRTPPLRPLTWKPSGTRSKSRRARLGQLRIPHRSHKHQPWDDQ